jgi:hypothetical protein
MVPQIGTIPKPQKNNGKKLADCDKNVFLLIHGFTETIGTRISLDWLNATLEKISIVTGHCVIRLSIFYCQKTSWLFAIVVLLYAQNFPVHAISLEMQI